MSASKILKGIKQRMGSCMNAQDVYRILEEDRKLNSESLIKDFLLPKFLNTGSTTICVNSKDVTAFLGK